MRTTLYPNPANDVLWLMVEEAEALPLRITVFDALGSSCHSCEFQPDADGPTSISVNGLPNGAYYLQMDNGRQDCMKSFMVVR